MMYGAGVKPRSPCKDTTLGTRLEAVRSFSILLLYIIELTIGNEGMEGRNKEENRPALKESKLCEDRNR